MAWIMAVCCAGQLKQAIGAEDDRQVAIQRALDQTPQCQGLGDYYWEIGDRQGVLVQGQHGRTIGPTTAIDIASASKWVFAAYVVQRLGSSLTSDQMQKLQLTSGYDNLNPAFCVGRSTVEACFNAADNSRLDATHVGLFSYNGGHMQKLMMDLGLGNFDKNALTTDLHRHLPLDAAFSYSSPQAAGGMRTTPAAYGDFLRRIIRGELAWRNTWVAIQYAPCRVAVQPRSQARHPLTGIIPWGIGWKTIFLMVMMVPSVPLEPLGFIHGSVRTGISMGCWRAEAIRQVR